MNELFIELCLIKMGCLQLAYEVIATIFLLGPGPGTLIKPEYHLWWFEALRFKPLIDLKAEKGLLLGQN